MGLMRRLLAALCLVAPLHALAQTPTHTAGSAIVNRSALDAAMGLKVDVVNGVLVSPTVTSTLSVLTASPSLNAAYAAGGLTNGALIAAGGNMIEYCPLLACVTTPSSGHQRASGLFWSTTAADGVAEENTVSIETVIQTGAFKPWHVSTPYAVGDNVEFQDARNAVYRATTAGVSAATGAGPSGTGSAIADGTVVWQWINAAAINGKVGLYDEAVVQNGAGNSWAQANNAQLMPGAIPAFNVNTEFDYTNNSGLDCAIGLANCNAIEVNVSGLNQSTTGIHLSSSNTGSKYGTIWGIRLNGDKLASQADIEIDSSGPIGISFGGSGFGGANTHALAAISDTSSGLNSIIVSGTKTGSDFNDVTSSPAAYANSGVHALGTILDTSNSPVVYSSTGTHAAETFMDASVAPAAIALSGTYALAAIVTSSATTPISLSAKAGQSVCFDGIHACASYSLATHKWVFADENDVVLMSIAATTGNVVARGAFSTGTP